MHRKAQGGVIAFVLIVDFIFIILWAFLIGPLLSQIGQNAMRSGATGLEALFFMNLNMVIFIALVLANLFVFRYGGDQ